MYINRLYLGEILKRGMRFKFHFVAIKKIHTMLGGDYQFRIGCNGSQIMAVGIW